MTTRCRICRKKIGTVQFICKCGMKLCSIHRYHTEHACTYDYKKNERAKLAEQNVRIVADKIADRL